MLPVERRDRIRADLKRSSVVNAHDLSRELDVSLETIRRDLAELEKTGILVRVHGGATSSMPKRGDEASFSERSGAATEAKALIGSAAAALIESGQTIFMDVGTTVLGVARAMPHDFSGVVATCSLLVAAELAERPNIEVLVSGGRLRRGDLSLSNAQALDFFADLHADIAFLGSGGIDAEAGLTDYHLDEVAVRKVMMHNAAHAYVLVDSSKLGRVARHKVADFSEFDGVITDQQPPSDIQEAISAAHGKVILPE